MKRFKKNVTFWQNELIRMDEIIKSLLETHASILKTVSKPSVGTKKRRRESFIKKKLNN